MNRNYKRGAALEYRMKDKLEQEGYFVIRAAGSHGVADLVAIMKYGSNHIILLVSCKLTQYAPPAERAELQKAADRIGARAVITVRGERNEWVLRPLD